MKKKNSEAITGKDKVKEKIVSKKNNAAVPLVPLSSLSIAERMANLPSYGRYITPDKVQGMFAHFLYMPIKEIQKLSLKENLPSLSVIEQQILSLVSRGMKGDRDSLYSIQYMHERAFGKPKQSVEVTGENHGPIRIDTNTVLEAMENLPKEVLNAILAQSDKDKG